ncbi:ABC transporter ATP-binding protein [Candidatus Halobonum tyrrellensis]|uniref:Cobalamin import ATP-binding protein BtuD n=1 Tax=Candidatus Halobonum tyrrellensis G22 TaxID=1324957 RepID=V4GXT9_9EURY|nr:ABC transporter ATP-binding protein [Candidatus Halobonum tyrrellensis]ESP89976.1 ABC transporter [Candidatus Halobonum tyrrellensis G22]
MNDDYVTENWNETETEREPETRTDGGESVAVAPETRQRSGESPGGPDGPGRSGESERSGCEFAGEELVIGYSSGEEPVIDGETLRVEPGEVTALVGPNGSGKSTLLKGLADQLSIRNGRVLLDGDDVYSLSAKELAKRLGLLSQENVSPNSIPVEKLVEHGRYPHRGFFDSLTDEDREAIDRAISLAGVDHLRDREVGSLSGGQKQLVWIAMVLAQETDVLLLDEPTTFLDLHHQLEVMEIVETLRDESDITVVVVLHDIDQAARYADHMVALKDGSIRAQGAPDEIVTEELLADVFEIEAVVEPTAYGPQITPLHPLHDEHSHGSDTPRPGDGS